MNRGKESFKYASTRIKEIYSEYVEERLTDYCRVDHSGDLDEPPSNDERGDAQVILKACTEEDHTACIECDGEIARPIDDINS